MAGTNTQSRKAQRTQRLSETVMAAYDLDTAIDVTRQLHESGMVPAPLTKIAAPIAGNERAQTFKTKVYSAAKFGLVSTRQDRATGLSEVSMLPLGEQTLDPERAREAKVRAFLNVPLNRAVYRQYQGQLLPPDEEIERFMHDELGITSGQLKNARQVLMRSARQAGFFEQGRDRLMIPSDVELPDEATLLHDGVPPVRVAIPNGTAPGTRLPTPEVPLVPLGETPTTTDSRQLDPAVAAWLRKIPSANETWPKQKRDRWLQMLGHLLDYVFDDEPPGARE